MFCPQCGTENPDGTAFCANCGTTLGAAAAPTSAPTPEPVAAPVNAAYDPQQQQYQQQYQQQQYQQYQPANVYTGPIEGDANKRAFAASLYWNSLIGVIIAVVTGNMTDPFIKFHVNQIVVLLISYVVCGILSIILIGLIAMIFVFVCQILGTVAAYHGEMKEMPLLGKLHIIK
jgi:uncharacterized membrane protein